MFKQSTTNEENTMQNENEIFEAIANEFHGNNDCADFNENDFCDDDSGCIETNDCWDLDTIEELLNA